MSGSDTATPPTAPAKGRPRYGIREKLVAIFIAKAVTGLRVSQEVELEGLDLGEHGERAYNM